MAPSAKEKSQSQSYPSRRQTTRIAWIAISSLLAFFLLFKMLSPSHSPITQTSPTRPNAKYTYATLPGYFAQSSPSTDTATFNFTLQDFGLTYPPTVRPSISIPPRTGYEAHHTSWQNFAVHVSDLASMLPPKQKLKVLFIGRHGQGVHNVAEAKYGTPAWNAKWAKLPGDGTLIWTDAALTGEGERQAEAAGRFWREQVRDRGMKAPEGYYVSPLARCLHTAKLEYEGLGGAGEENDGEVFRPMVKEGLRETMGVHLCDRRSGRAWIERTYPTYRIEEGLSEQDELWDAEHRETDAEQVERLGAALDEIFEADERAWLSLTCHSGASKALLKVLGHREWRLKPGEIIPVLVNARLRS